MPQISDLVEKKKFVKKTFRPWDLSGTGTLDTPNDDGMKTIEPVSTVASDERPMVVQRQLLQKKTLLLKKLSLLRL